jgi:predicted kinase
MTTPSQPRSVKIAQDERTGWSSDRPRKSGGPERKPDISTRCRVLAPSDRLRYSPGSLLVVVSASEELRERFAGGMIQEKGALFTMPRIRALIAGRVDESVAEQKAAELLQAAVQKRLTAGETVVVVAEGLEPEAREAYVRAAAGLRRPRHLMLLETPKDQVDEEDRAPLNELRRALDAGELGQEGFQTAIRMSAGALKEIKAIVFRPAPQED